MSIWSLPSLLHICILEYRLAKYRELGAKSLLSHTPLLCAIEELLYL